MYISISLCVFINYNMEKFKILGKKIKNSKPSYMQMCNKMSIIDTKTFKNTAQIRKIGIIYLLKLL